MKNTLLSLVLMVLFCHCSTDHNNDLISEKINKHHEASDQFYIQRSWPDGQINLKAYDNALKAAKHHLSEKNELPGFDKDWIACGPGNIGARINTIAVHPENKQIIYVGFAVGGVFKTSNGGATWEPIFDDNTYLAIGDIVIDPDDPDIVYVGTGDPNISGYPFLGDGIYKSEDGGITWEHLGLEAERIVSKIIIDPQNSSTLYVSCMGLPFERNPERGLYKSTDGGQNWEQILFASEQAGIIDMVMDPFDNQVIYAAAWDRIRNNQESVVHGPNAKIYKTEDGGSNWTELAGGLPDDDIGRIGLAISETTPGEVYAMYVGTDRQLYNVFKTSDAGQNWSTIIDWNDPGLNLPTGILGGFGWYFGKIRLNPANSNELYILGVRLWKSQNGGQTWFDATPPSANHRVHADKHDLLFTHPDTILLATDGGLYKSPAQDTTWEDIENIPATQFYRVAYNPHKPDFYYGGAQDNGSLGGNALDTEWDHHFGGDGFQMLFHPLDTNIVFAEAQNGYITVTANGLYYSLWSYAVSGIDEEDRRNWDMPYIMSPQNPDIMYTGTYRVYKNEFGGQPYWEAISPSLTDSVIYGNGFHTISTLDQSPLLEGLLYVGTTDGNVWKTEDDGETWVDIASGLPDRYITDIKTSPAFLNSVYVSVSGYKYNDFDPHIFKSENGGNSWESIAGDLPNLAINDLYVLPGHLDSVIFAATDGGVYGTIDAGVHWHRLGSNMPIIPVYDMIYNPINNELVAGTHARSVMSYNLDSLFVMPPDVTSYIEMEKKENLVLFPSPTLGNLNIKSETILNTRPFELTIINELGAVVYKAERNSKSNIDVSSLSNGLYFATVKQGEKEWKGKFVKLD